jgi:CheY-like chemotaxis protein/anti-sigma regulatory factor (Ser/Thr protein kinase)
MSRVLVVDDSAVARHTISKILANDNSIEIATAVDGQEGLEKISSIEPDLVITDMVMPRLNGLELVEKLKNSHSSLPVILVTSTGNEEIAAEALRLGAASYVPKHLLKQYLLETVQELLQITAKKRDDTRLLGHLTKGEFFFELSNDHTLVAPLVAYLQESIGQIVNCDPADLTRVGVALDEALRNALYHGNLEVSSDLRDEGDGSAFLRLAADRAEQMPYKNRQIKADVKITIGEFQITIQDQGPGFDPASLPDPTDPHNLDKVSGRGVMLMRVFMDEISYNDAGNQVTLVKRW